MEPSNEISACPEAASTGSKLRYPLRSSSKLNNGKPLMPDVTIPSISKRGKPSSSVSKSVDVLNLSSKMKSARPPRRLSNPAKSAISPSPALFGSITPISETVIKRANAQGSSDTPLSETSSSSRRKFNVLTSVSYWLTQIKLAESVSKHSISLGFFMLALESGCEPINRMREEFKSYACKHNLLEELGEPMKDLSERYNILEDLQKLCVSKTASKLTEQGKQTLGEDAEISSATERTGNLKPRSLNSKNFREIVSDKKEGAQKRSTAAKTMATVTNPVSVKDDNSKNTQKKPKNPNRVTMTNGGNGKVKGSARKFTDDREKVDSVGPLATEEVSHENKENMDVVLVEEAMSSEVIEAKQTNQS